MWPSREQSLQIERASTYRSAVQPLVHKAVRAFELEHYGYILLDFDLNTTAAFSAAREVERAKKRRKTRSSYETDSEDEDLEFLQLPALLRVTLLSKDRHSGDELDNTKIVVRLDEGSSVRLVVSETRRRSIRHQPLTFRQEALMNVQITVQFFLSDPSAVTSYAIVGSIEGENVTLSTSGLPSAPLQGLTAQCLHREAKLDTFDAVTLKLQGAPGPGTSH